MADLHSTIETLERQWMRAWVNRDTKALKALTARNFRMVVGSKPSVLLDAKSWVEAATTRFSCTAYRYGDIYVRDLGPMTMFAAQLTLEATMDGHDWSGTYWVTDLWRKSKVRRNWRMVERIVSRPDEQARRGGGDPLAAIVARNAFPLKRTVSGAARTSFPAHGF